MTRADTDQNTPKDNVVRIGAAWLDQPMDTRRGPKRRGPKLGASQRGNAPRYDIGSGATWRPNPTLEPAQAVKLYRAMEAMGTSASAVINQLLALMPVDEKTGLPTWAEHTEQGTLLEDLPVQAA